MGCGASSENHPDAAQQVQEKKAPPSPPPAQPAPAPAPAAEAPPAPGTPPAHAPHPPPEASPAASPPPPAADAAASPAAPRLSSDRPKGPPPKSPSFGVAHTIHDSDPHARPSQPPEGAKQGALRNKNFRIVLPPLNFGDASGPVEKSWNLVRADIGPLGNKVVHKWFTKYPHHLQLFPFRDAPDLTTDPRSVAHGKSVLSAVGAVVSGMRDVEALSSTIDHLAVVHMSKGVHRDMFPALNWAIMSTLEEALGPEWTAEVAGAWESVFEKLAARINEAMEQAAQQEAEAKNNPQEKTEKDDNAEEPVPESKFGNLKSIERGGSFNKGKAPDVLPEDNVEHIPPVAEEAKQEAAAAAEAQASASAK